MVQVQAQPLPRNLPFRIVSRTIGTGAYAFIRKACPHNASSPVIAVKFINKEHAYKLGRVKPKQIATEVALHSHVGKHQNIIQFLSTGEDLVWTWIAMELASEGDLFDKIEADAGVGEMIAHFYFAQLVSAVGYMHSKGVAHRDIKPENMLLSDGDLKLADFGLAALFSLNGQRKTCQTICGSPPYMAPEVVPREGFAGGNTKTAPYEGDAVDIWSCGIVLFVLLVGNTPWDEPTAASYEFDDYVRNGPQPETDELWAAVPIQALSLLKGMLKVNPRERFTLEDVRRHPWFTQRNIHLAPDGRAANPVVLATQMLESLRIDFSQDPTAVPCSQRRRAGSVGDAMDLDSSGPRLALTQPEIPLADMTSFDWEQPSRVDRLYANGAGLGAISASQPAALPRTHHTIPLTLPLRPHTRNTAANHMYTTTQTLRLTQADVLSSRLLSDPALSQFSATPSVPLSVTQQARRFRDIIPSAPLSRFLSFLPLSLLLPLVSEAFARLGIPVPGWSEDNDASVTERAALSLKTRDGRNCVLAGWVVVERVEEEVVEVRFVKAKGDPVEWRRLFKRVAVLCAEGVVRPE